MEGTVTLKSFYSDTMEIVREQAKECGISVESALTDFLMDYLKLEGVTISPELITCVNTECKRETDFSFYKMNGFDYSEESGVLDLFLTYFIDKDEVTEYTKSKIEHSHNALYRFFMSCIENDALLNKYKNEDPDIAEVIETIRSEYKKKNIHLVRFYFLTNGFVKGDADKTEDLTIGLTGCEIPLEEYIWDIEAARQSDIAARQEPFVDIDLENVFQPLECIPCDENPEVKSYLAVIPAMTLAEIYDKYRVRLLNQNVRNYLGGRKTINKKMLETIRKNGGRFFAYNNGISSTAYSVRIETNDEGRLVIKGMHNWQIVNGGQTTNVIHYIYSQKKERDLLHDVNVALKITEIKIQDEEEKKKAISNIARYANSQNQVKESDFAVNEPYMHTLKELSKKETAPQGSKRQGTKWFFVRMRGEYEDAKTSNSLKKQREFLKIHPKNQVLEKTDVAKLEMAWDMQPHISCLGGEKCFDKFWKIIDKQDSSSIDDVYFHNLVAKAIIIQKVYDLYMASGFKGYANIIQYYALASIAMRSHGKFDLEYIWKHQDVQPSLIPILQKAIEIISTYIKVIANDGNNTNISSAAKKTDFWDKIRLRLNNLPEFESSLLVVGETQGLTASQKAELMEFDEIPASNWNSLAVWAKISRKLSLLERKKIEHVAIAVEKGKDIGYTYASEALSIYRKSQNMGWSN